VSKSHSACRNHSFAFWNHNRECRNHIRACPNHNACGNYNLCVGITFERVVVLLVRVIFTCIGVKITLVCVDLRVKSHYAYENRILRVDINLLRVEITLVRVVIKFVHVLILLVSVIITPIRRACQNHNACGNHIRAFRYHTRECHIHTLRVKIILCV
jgi:hypothetical protein